MDMLQMAILAINGIRLVLVNPALGGGSSVRLDQASELLGILGTLLLQGDSAREDLKEFTGVIEAMVKDGREPTSTEWAFLRARSDDAHNRLQDVKKELLAEEEEPAPAPTPEPPPPQPTVVVENTTPEPAPETDADGNPVPPAA